MQFQSKTRDEIDAEKRSFAEQGLLPNGWYDFEVMGAEEKTSKAGNEMIALKLRVFNPRGGEKHVYDYLLESNAIKMFDFCESVGLLDKYEAGTLTAEDCLLRAARVKIATDSKNPQYAPKNVVKAYAVVQSGSTTPAPSEPDDDDVPF
jgi:hypothetical protein